MTAYRYDISAVECKGPKGHPHCWIGLVTDGLIVVRSMYGFANKDDALEWASFARDEWRQRSE